MITINNIKVIVKDESGTNFGFNYNFFNGLNILTGENSSGKSTVLSCIYYCLGLEQLITNNNSDGLAECLKVKFRYNDQDITVDKSHAELSISNDRGDKSIIKRLITNAKGINANTLYIFVNGGEREAKYIHSEGDSEHNNGFYKWLADFIGIELPVFHDSLGHSTKILYLQQILSSSFVEQTRGWSDFFAQIPIFATKKPKQKIIEYILNLQGLVEEFEKDKLNEQEKEKKRDWANNVENFRTLVSYYNFDTPSVTEKFVADLKPMHIDNLKLLAKAPGGVLEDLELMIERVDGQLKTIVEKNKTVQPETNLSEPLLSDHFDLSSKLNLLKKDFSRIEKEKLEEDLKRASYKNTLEQINEEIETLEGFKKVSSFTKLNIDHVKNCPVCNSLLTKEVNSPFRNLDRVDSFKSISFYKSEASLYKSYLEKSDDLIKRFDQTLTYYKGKITEIHKMLNQINLELVDDQRIPSRFNISREMSLKFEMENLNKIEDLFSQFKKKSKKLAEELEYIRIRKSELKLHEDDDKELVDNFQKKFTSYLKEYGYSKELISRIFIARDDPSKLFPLVKVFDGRPSQPIRLMSSASDFIRALWSFYVSLLTEASKHAGILVLDEPGQHAMDSDDLVSLLKSLSAIKHKQTILAISKDHKTNKEVKLDTILANTNLIINADYHLNEIVDNNRKDKSVQPFNNDILD